MDSQWFEKEVSQLKVEVKVVDLCFAQECLVAQGEFNLHKIILTPYLWLNHIYTLNDHLN